MNHGSLFSGIGGFDLAAEWMGWENKFHCEWNEFGQKVLKYYWPNATSYENIKTTDFSIWRGKISILTGGFPCQPYSNAGKRKGKEDERHLWPEMLRAIREIQPKYIVGENVYGIVNWNGGMVFDEVQSEMEAAGYEVIPVILPACGINAPHRRERVWFIAFNSNGSTNRQKESVGGKNRGGIQESKQERIFRETYNKFKGFNNIQHKERAATDTNSIGLSGQRRTERQINTKEDEYWKKYRIIDDGGWPYKSPIRGRNDGISERLDIESISEKNWCEQTIQGFGNAIVPQVAFEIFKIIELIDNEIAY